MCHINIFLQNFVKAFQADLTSFLGLVLCHQYYFVVNFSIAALQLQTDLISVHLLKHRIACQFLHDES